MHNRYRPDAPSGENRVVDQESAALREVGCEVQLFERHSGDIASWSAARRATLPMRVVWSEDSRRDLEVELARFRPDVVHLHNTFPLVTPSVLRATWSAGVPVVATLHNYKLACASGDFYRDGAVCHDCRSGSMAPALRHGCYRGSRAASVPVVASALLHRRAWATMVSAFVFISSAQQALLGSLGLPGERSFVKYNFVPDVPAVQREKAPYVASIGRLDEAKGIPLLMRGWDAFRRRRPDSQLRLVIGGAGPMSHEVAEWASRRPSVELLGMLARTEVFDVLGRARAALMPSQWEETFGLVAVEAMAVGTAPIAPAHGSFPELVEDGVDGLLFAPGDPEALATALVGVDDDPALWERRGAAGQRTFERRFRREDLLKRLLEIYRFAIENPAHAVRSPVVSDQPSAG